MPSAKARQGADLLFDAPYITSNPDTPDGDSLNLRVGGKEYTAWVAVLADHTSGECYYGGAGVRADYSVEVRVLEISEEVSGTVKKGPRWNQVAKKIRDALLNGRRFSESNVGRFLVDYQAGIDSFAR